MLGVVDEKVCGACKGEKKVTQVGHSRYPDGPGDLVLARIVALKKKSESVFLFLNILLYFTATWKDRIKHTIRHHG
jgi:hypothetical protein